MVLIAPGGTEQVMDATADASGALTLKLSPPNDVWQLGLYRVVLGMGGGAGVSATFAVIDGQPHLFAGPYLPSPTSAFNFVGTGFGPGSTVGLTLLLTGGQGGAKTFSVVTDAAGSFSRFVWPQQFNLPFFAAGDYRVQSDGGLHANFQVREHPVGASISIPATLVPGQPEAVHLHSYTSGRYLWAIYATSDGHVAGEFLFGPTDAAGNAEATAVFPSLAPGAYLLATPYDWGETAFEVLDPTATATLTPSSTSTPAPTSTPVKHRHHKRHKKRRKPL
jgi:hypothetical protein